MPQVFLVGLGAGVAAALMFMAPIGGSVIAFPLFLLTGLPIGIVGLGWGIAASATAAFAAAAIIHLTVTSIAAIVFLLLFGAPMIWLARLALMSRPVDHASPDGAREWYPIGRLVGWAAIIAGALAGIMVLMLGYDVDTYRESIKDILQHSALKELDRDGSVINDSTIGGLSSVLARTLPAAFAVVWQSIALFNLWLAGVIVEASGRALRPCST